MPIAFDGQTPDDKKNQTIVIAVVVVLILGGGYIAYKKFKK